MRQKNEYVVMKIYIFIYIFSTLVVGIKTLVNYEPYGEAIGMTLKMSRFEIGMILIVQILTLASTYVFFSITKKSRLSISSGKIKLLISDKKIHGFMFLILLLQIIFSLKTGNGRLGHETKSHISSFMNMLNVKSFFPIYYFCGKRKKLYWINLFMFCIYEIICGWSSFVFTLLFYELFIRLREDKNKYLKWFNSKTYIPLSTLFLLLGGRFYSYLYRIKFYVREGYDAGHLSFLGGLSRLISRFTNFPVSLVGIQEHRKIVELSRLQNGLLTEIMIVFRSLVPGRIWVGKADLRAFGNIVLQSLYPTLESSTSTGYLCWVYWGNIFESSKVTFLFYFIALIIFTFISKKLIYSFETEPGKMDFLYFELIFRIFDGSTMEGVFGYGYIGLLYILPIMFILGIVKVERIYGNEYIIYHARD